MSDSRSARLRLELITQTMNGLAQKVGMMEPDEPKRDSCVLEKLFQLSQLRRSLKAIIDPIGERMDELAREMTTLKAGDPRRAQIVQEKMQTGD